MDIHSAFLKFLYVHQTHQIDETDSFIQFEGGCDSVVGSRSCRHGQRSQRDVTKNLARMLQDSADIFQNDFSSRIHNLDRQDYISGAQTVHTQRFYAP